MVPVLDGVGVAVAVGVAEGVTMEYTITPLALVTVAVLTAGLAAGVVFAIAARVVVGTAVVWAGADDCWTGVALEEVTGVYS